jgi:CheY-like chemotaxis protein
MSFLYRGFLHAGTEVRLNLNRRAGGQEQVTSTVVWCRHIVGPHHLVGVKFRQRIYPPLFIESLPDAEDAAPPVDPRQLRGTVLLVDDQETDRMLFEHHIKATQMKVTAVGNVESALTVANQTAFDLVLCDLNLGVCRGEEVIQQLRARGFSNPVIALTAEHSDLRLKAAQAAGAQCVIFKPYDPHALLAVIASVLGCDGTDGEEPIYSEMAGTAGADALIAQCIEKVRSVAADLHKAMADNDFHRVRTLAQTLKGSGNGFGFSILTSTAKRAVDAMDASQTILESVEELRRLVSVCHRLAPGRDPRGK